MTHAFVCERWYWIRILPWNVTYHQILTETERWPAVNFADNWRVRHKNNESNLLWKASVRKTSSIYVYLCKTLVMLHLWFILTVNVAMVILLTTSSLQSYCHNRNPKSRPCLCRGASSPFIRSYKTFLRCSGNCGLLSLLHFNITTVWPSDQTFGLYICRCPDMLVFKQVILTTKFVLVWNWFIF